MTFHSGAETLAAVPADSSTIDCFHLSGTAAVYQWDQYQPHTQQYKCVPVHYNETALA